MRSFPQAILLTSLSLSLSSRADTPGIIFTTPRDSMNGSFNFPRTYPLTFRESSTINITWDTLYESVNLYYYQRGQVAQSILLATYQAIKWYKWEVHTDSSNLTDPFVFRVVNAQGDSTELSSGGFWSASFYIGRSESDASSSMAPSALASRSATVQVPVTTSTVPGTTLKPDVVEPSLSPVLSMEYTPSSRSQAAGTATATERPNSSASRAISKTAIIGLSVGLIVSLTLVVGVLYLLKQRKKTQARQLDPKVQGISPNMHENQVQPSEMEGSKTCFELSGENNPPVLIDGRDENK